MEILYSISRCHWQFRITLELSIKEDFGGVVQLIDLNSMQIAGTTRTEDARTKSTIAR